MEKDKSHWQLAGKSSKVEEWGSFPVENQQCGGEERPPSAAAGKRSLDSELGRGEWSAPITVARTAGLK